MLTGQVVGNILGDVHVGSNKYQLDHLISKWFLGADLPSTSGGWTNGGTYRQDYKPLFSAGGTPLVSDVGQGAIGDCYFLAAAAEVAKFEPEKIKSMFTDNGNGTYGVRFYKDGQPVYVTVNNDVYADGAYSARATQNTSWVPLLEKAYVQFRSESNPGYNNYNLINGGWGEGLSAITGCNVNMISCGNYRSSYDWHVNVDNQIINALSNKQEVLYGSYQNTYNPMNGNRDLVSAHMYSVTGYDPYTRQFILRNPWGGDYDVEFEVASETLWNYGQGGAFLVADKGYPSGLFANATVGGGYISPANQTANPLTTTLSSYLPAVAAGPAVNSTFFAAHA